MFVADYRYADEQNFSGLPGLGFHLSNKSRRFQNGFNFKYTNGIRCVRQSLCYGCRVNEIMKESANVFEKRKA